MPVLRESAEPDSPEIATRHTEPSPDRVAEEAAAIYRDTSPAPPTEEEIAAEAYAIYVARGQEDGHDQDDWLEAERRLTSRRQSS